MHCMAVALIVACSYMPLPHTPVDTVHWRTMCEGSDGCYWDGKIYLDPAAPPHTFLHEEGHSFDERYMWGYRRRYCRIRHLSCADWQTSDHGVPTSEYFADDFRFCAQDGNWTRFQLDQDRAQTYGLAPVQESFTRVCFLIRHAAAKTKFRASLPSVASKAVEHFPLTSG